MWWQLDGEEWIYFRLLEVTEIVRHGDGLHIELKGEELKDVVASCHFVMFRKGIDIWRF